MPRTYANRTDRFSGNCEHCIYPVVVSDPDYVGDIMFAMCPGCTTTTRCERLYGTFTSQACDPRCQYAHGNVCDCACGGANHRAGYLPPIPGGEVPASALDRFRRQAAAHRAAGARRRETNALRRAAQAAAAATVRAERVAGFLSENPAVAQAYDWAQSATPQDDRDRYAVATINDIHARHDRWGSISFSQADFVARLHREAISRAEARQRPPEARVEAPVGRVRVEGVVIKADERQSEYDGSTYWKLTLKCRTPDGFYFTWLTKPRGLRVARGDVISMVASLSRSDRDPSFAFGKRPSGATVIGTESVTETEFDSMAAPA